MQAIETDKGLAEVRGSPKDAKEGKSRGGRNKGTRPKGGAEVATPAAPIDTLKDLLPKIKKEAGAARHYGLVLKNMNIADTLSHQMEGHGKEMETMYQQVHKMVLDKRHGDTDQIEMLKKTISDTFEWYQDCDIPK